MTTPRQARVALRLERPRRGDTRGDRGTRLGGGRQDQVGRRDRRHLDPDVDAVEERPREPRLIVGDAARTAPADMARLAGHAAAAGIHGADELKARGKADPVVGPRDRRLAGFERLAERIEHLRREFRQLVEEEDAVMGERGLARPHPDAAADHRRHRGRVMRAPERPPRGQPAIADLAGDRGDHRHFEELGRRERRQDRRQPARQHRLAGAGRPDHQNIVYN